jgi:hypothetical protein
VLPHGGIPVLGSTQGIFSVRWLLEIVVCWKDIGWCCGDMVKSKRYSRSISQGRESLEDSMEKVEVAVRSVVGFVACSWRSCKSICISESLFTVVKTFKLASLLRIHIPPINGIVSIDAIYRLYGDRERKGNLKGSLSTPLVFVAVENTSAEKVLHV